MHLDREQEGWLSGESGEHRRWAMEVLVKLAESTGADRMVPVTSVHVPRWCDEGSAEAWESLSEIAGRSPIRITANPSTEEHPDPMREKVLEHLRPQGSYSFSCAPYLSGNHPGKGEHAAWGGRAATAFVNSVLGARSEMESLETAAASAVTHLTPWRGLHVDGNRRPTVAVQLPSAKAVDYTALGHGLSRVLKEQVPVLCGARPTFDEAKKLAFAINSRGTVPLFRMQRDTFPPAGMEAMELDGDPSFYRSPLRADPDLVILGCPHLSEQEINRWSKKLAGRPPSTTKIWFFTSRICMDKCPTFGAVLRSRGRMFADLCPLAMTDRLAGRSVACDSPTLAECLSSRGISAFYSTNDELLSYMVR